MKTLIIHCLSIVLIGVAIGWVVPVWGDESTDRLGKALDLVHQVEKSAGASLTDAQRIDLLTQAIATAQEAPNHRLKGHRVLAIQAIRSAIGELGSGDASHKAAAFLQTADTELSASLALAQADQATGVASPASTSTPMAPPSPTETPPQPSTSSGPAVVPPEVTPEMEQAFLVKYKAAVEKPDPDAFFSLFAFDPKMDPKVKEDMKGLYLFSLAMVTSNPERTYSFVPVPPGQKNEPSPFKGKMYGDYLPAVVGLKITFGKPPSPSPDAAIGDSTLPLCIQDHQLMMVGTKEIPGAVPPPAVDKAANFGIEPNLRKVSNASDEDDGFASVNEFLSSLKQSSVEILASGETKFEYYAICRIAPNLCVIAGGDKRGQGNYSFYFKAKDSSQQELKGRQKWVRLVDVPTDNGQAPCVQGTLFEVPEHYTGAVTVEGQYQDDAGNKAANFSRTVEWK